MEKKELVKGFQTIIEDLLDNYEKYTDEECKAHGINDSMIHVDFMIGSRDMSIVGVTKDGKRVQIFSYFPSARSVSIISSMKFKRSLTSVVSVVIIYLFFMVFLVV